MMAIKIDPNERAVVRLFDQPETRIRITPKTLMAWGVVAVFYAGLAGLVMQQRVDLTPEFVETPPVIIDTFIPDPPVPTPPDPVKETVVAVRAPENTFIPALVERLEAVTTPSPLPLPGPVEAIPVTPAPVTPTAIAPVTPTPAPSMIRNPSWVQRPTQSQMAKLFPDRAAELGKSGAATLECRVLATGAVNACTVVDEAPKGWKFGDAALASTRYFKLSPRTVDGAAIEGAKVRIPMVFNAE